MTDDKDVVYIHSELHSALKKVKFARKWVELGKIIQSEVRRWLSVSLSSMTKAEDSTSVPQIR